MKNIKEIFEERTCSKFSDKQIDKKLLEEIYSLMKLGPTSANSCPLRIKFVSSDKSKEKLVKCVSEGNIEKVKIAPITALFAFDSKFYDLMPKLYPINLAIKDYFSSSEKVAYETAFRNSTLQAAYFIMIARGYGLDCGPMSGFDAEALNKTFFENSNFKINFICTLGYKAENNPYPRLARLEFLEACEII